MDANSSSELQAWREWRRLCAIGRLPPPEAAQLRAAIAVRFRGSIRRYCDHFGLAAGAVQAPGDEDCAHLFETHCALHHRADGKAYKHWLLARGDQSLDAVQSGVSLLARMVVRDWLRREHAGKAETSLDSPPPGASQPLSELLPTASRDNDLPAGGLEWAEDLLPRLLANLHPIEQKLLRIRRSGRELYDPEALREHHIGKSALYNHQKKLFQRLAEAVRADYPDLSAAAAARLGLELLDRLVAKA